MSFINILFESEAVYKQWYDTVKSRYDCVNSDINLNKIAEFIQQSRPDFPTQYMLYPCSDFSTIKLRLEVFKELYENDSARGELVEFIKFLSYLNKCREKEYESENTEQKHLYFLDTAAAYIECTEKLYEIIKPLQSAAFVRLGNALYDIINADKFKNMTAKAEELRETFAGILNLTLSINYSSKNIIVDEPAESGFYSEITELCENILGFRPNTAFSVVNSNPITALEKDIITVLKKRFPDAFEELLDFYDSYSRIGITDVINLRSQLLFYSGYIEFVKKAEKTGIKFTLPVFNENEFVGKGLYDLSLALKIQNVVPNDFRLEKGNLFILSGPNQGGKTTFIRGLAQSIVLAQNGCFVPAEYYETPYFDKLLTHFNHSETLGHGRLEEELERIEKKLPLLTENSFVIFNECFTSTRRVDGVKLALNLLNKLFGIGCSGGFVTHYYEIPEHDSRLVSFVAGVKSDGTNDDIRTYKIIRQPPDGTAYAKSIALKCGVTLGQLEEVIHSYEKS